MDTKKVRRPNAALVEPYATGSMARALKTAADPRLLHKARRMLRTRIYSASTWGPRRARLSTVRRLVEAAGHAYLPVTPQSLMDCMSSLHNGGYRSLANYVGDWRREHLDAGHSWTEGLAALRTDLLRASIRGQGPAKRASTYGAERLPRHVDTREQPKNRGGPKWPWLLLVVGTCWMLRGAEAADLLGEQASVDATQREASLDLCATKMDPAGTGCLRTLRCICDGDLAGPCPYCALASLLEARERAGLTGKDPLFPTRAGRAATAKAVCRTLSKLLGLRVTEHSLRREGAQLYARREVPLYLVQLLGRWGGPTVQLYVAEALRGQLARSASARVSSSGSAGPGLSTAELLKSLEQLVEDAVAKKAADGAFTSAAGEPDPLSLSLTTSLDLPGAPGCATQQKVRPLKGDQEMGWMHDVLLCDPALPKEAWITRCGWRFGGSQFRLHPTAETTCSRCIGRRATELRRAAGLG